MAHCENQMGHSQTTTWYKSRPIICIEPAVIEIDDKVLWNILLDSS